MSPVLIIYVVAFQLGLLLFFIWEYSAGSPFGLPLLAWLIWGVALAIHLVIVTSAVVVEVGADGFEVYLKNFRFATKKYIEYNSIVDVETGYYTASLAHGLGMRLLRKEVLYTYGSGNYVKVLVLGRRSLIIVLDNNAETFAKQIQSILQT